MPTRNASARWDGGGLKAGKGTFSGDSGLTGAYTFASRFEDGKGSNPEELLAAADAACYSMALSAALERNATPPKWVETKAACTVERVGEGPKITTMKLQVRASVPGIDNATFQRLAEETKEHCPVGGAIKGNVAISVTAALEG